MYLFHEYHPLTICYFIYHTGHNFSKYHELEYMPKCFGNDVSGATLGIIGMGRVGYKVAKRAQGFDMRILYHNRNQR